MSALIEEFKKEHIEFVEALKEVEELGILTKEGQAKLMYLKVRLLEHLRKEDEEFYPVLRKAAGHNVVCVMYILYPTPNLNTLKGGI